MDVEEMGRWMVTIWQLYHTSRINYETDRSGAAVYGAATGHRLRKWSTAQLKLTRLQAVDYPQQWLGTIQKQNIMGYMDVVYEMEALPSLRLKQRHAAAFCRGIGWGRSRC
eukprot:TRINITY_DN8512_c0_g2_i3.p2 TRINITY_DN8512_c0_g2~~TRINITY_DN8512_c0_g2_i3.p2  ORF type:complete len:111 (+),score=9.87 TRINITY_DN8512_c0_g2_i3:331-663(+)